MDTEFRHSARKRVLVVEDDTALSSMLVQTLKSVGLEPFAELRGDTAYRKVLELRPDLVLLDVNLPGMMGYDVCRQIKSDPRVGDCLVLMMTGEMKQVEDKLKGFDMGADDYVTKPFDLPVLLARVFSLLRIEGVAG